MPTSKPIPEELYAYISEHSILSSLPADSRNQLIADASLMIFKHGESLINENTPNNMFFLILNGEATAIMNATPAGSLGAGDIAGEISSIGMSPPIASVIADTSLEAIAFPSESIIQASRTHAEFASHLRKSAFKRVTG